MASEKSAASRLIPATAWLASYKRTWLRSDVLAGATAAAVVLPQALAYATIAELPVQAGLYCAIVPMALYALMGGSRRLSVSVTSTVSALTASTLAAADVGDDPAKALGAATTLAVLVGLVLLAAGSLRLGFLADQVSDAVIVGLKAGIGIAIAAGQLSKLLGVEGGDGFYDDVRAALEGLDEAHGATVLVGLGAIAALVLTRRLAPRLPATLVVLAGVVVLTSLLDLGDRGVALVPDVPSGLPPAAVPPFDRIEAMLPGALAIALLAFLESISAARSVRLPTDPPLDNNAELRALGVGSAGGGFFGAYPPSGGFSQTAVNAEAGARTQVSALVTAGLAVATVLFLAPVVEQIPEAALGAVVLVAALGLVSLAAFDRIRRIRPAEAGVALLTAVVALSVGLLAAVLVGVAVSIIGLLAELNRPVVVELGRRPGTDVWRPREENDQTVAGLLVVRPEMGLYAGNIRYVQGEILRLVESRVDPPGVVLLDGSAIADVSYTAIEVLGETARLLDERGATLWIAALPTRALATWRRLPDWAEWDEAGRLHPRISVAIDAFERRDRAPS